MKIDEPKTPFGNNDSDEEADNRKEEEESIYSTVNTVHCFYS